MTNETDWEWLQAEANMRALGWGASKRAAAHRGHTTDADRRAIERAETRRRVRAQRRMRAFG